MSTPIGTETVTFDVHDAKIGALLTDNSGDTDPTYDDWLDVPGVQQVQVNPNFITAELKGDAKTLDTRGKTSGFDCTLNYALLEMEILEVLFGGTFVNTDGNKADWSLNGTNSVPYFRLAFAIDDVSSGLGNLVVVLWKSKVSGGNLFDQQTDQYGTRSLSISAIPCLSNDRLINVTLNKTLTTIETAYPAAS
jgi:hypothetical protein